MNALLTSLPNFCDENSALQITIPSDKRLLEVCEFINECYHENHSIEELAEKANLSTRSLQRIFKQETGISVKKYIQLIKILKSVELIDSNQFTLSEIAYKIGYKSLSAFTSSYLAVMNVKPKVIKKVTF
jgi:AraC-like DNA-binding protein